MRASAGHTHALPPQWKVRSALGAVYVIWGSTYLAIRVMVRDVPPLLGAGARFAIAGTAMLAVLRARGMRVRVTKAQLAAAAIVGLLLPAGGNGVVTVAERHVPSGLAALLVASEPLWIAVLRGTAGRERVAGRTIGGLLLGFAGLAVLLLPGARPADATVIGIVLVLIAALSWAIGSFFSPRLPLPRDSFVSTGWQMVWGGAILLVAAVVAGEPGQVDLGAIGWNSWLALAYLIVAGSWVAFTCYAWLLQNAPMSQVATYAYVNPLVAVLLGWAILGETLSPGTLAGAALVVASVFVIVSRESPTRQKEPAVARARRARHELLDETRSPA
jgi:drug/metabolite transporter (DMT)-like permease